MMAALDFSRRNALTELMDSQETDFATFRACLVDLAKVNRLTRAFRPTLAFFEILEARGCLPRDRRISIVDIGSGSGDMLRQIDRWARRRGYTFDLVGVDLNPWSTATAQELTPHGRSIRFITANIFDYNPAAPIDIVISSLFTHHLEDLEVIKFVEWMEAKARIAWFINDLHRHPFPYHVFRLASRALRFHHFVQHDGPISVARAFTADDWRRLLEIANVAAEVRRHFPYRLCVTRVKAP